jgi:hypothetical protein
VDENTLEARLQNVARRMVQRPANGQTGMQGVSLGSAQLPASNGFLPGATGQPAGQLGQQQQQGQVYSGALPTMLVQSPGTTANGLAGDPGHTSMAMVNAATGQPHFLASTLGFGSQGNGHQGVRLQQHQGGTAALLAAPSLPQMDASLGQANFVQQPGSQFGTALLRPQGMPGTASQIMSNGAPIIRNTQQRDWSTMVNVNVCSTPTHVFNATGCFSFG